VMQCVPRWGDRIGTPQSSTASGDGVGTIDENVAVIDSGIDPTHPDLDVAGGVNCAQGKDYGFTDPNGHGTMVAGIIGARDNAVGIVGVAPGVRLWSARVLNKKLAGNISNLICGIDFVTSTRTDADPSNDVAVANMSIIGKGADDGNCGLSNRDALHTAICNSVAAGVTYVVAAGNASKDLASSTPATYSEVLTMTAMEDFDGLSGGTGSPVCGAVGDDDSYASFSNFASLASDQSHTLAGSGWCISSTYPGADYFTDSGTSFASPMGAGTAALCIDSGPCAGLTPAQIVAKLVADAAAYNVADPSYGFVGDPAHPVAGHYYGYLLRAALY